MDSEPTQRAQPTPSAAPATALFLTADLIFMSRVGSVASTAGFRVQVVSNVAAALQRVGEENVRLLILDLTLPGCRPATLMQSWTTLKAPPPVVAYGPHVAESQLAEAQEAGCAEVLSRGQFDRSIDAILKRYLGDEASAD
jgi:CheY-like chemotaxis protein